MSDFSAHRALEEAHERSERSGGDPTMAIAAAIFAVFAALTTMLSHSRSTTALAEKNEAIIAQGKATDKWNQFEADRVKFHIYQGLFDAGLATPAVAKTLETKALIEERKSKPLQKQAGALELRAGRLQESSELALHAHETFEIAVTLFEVSIVFVSISALAKTKPLIYIAFGSAAIGVIFLIKGLLTHF